MAGNHAVVYDAFLFISQPPISKGSTRTGENLLLQQQVLSFQNRALSKMVTSSLKVNRKSQKLFPFVNIKVKTYTLTI